jgi:MerR family transcriptional regulator, redox-sensitive transcriptional activator SoxR
MSPEKISIGELSKRSGLAPSAIRFYESCDLLHSTRTEGGQRRYDPATATTLRIVNFAKSAGFTLSEISGLLGPIQSGEPLFEHWRVLAERKLVELDAVISQAEEMKRRLHHALICPCSDPEKCSLLDDSKVEQSVR